MHNDQHIWNFALTMFFIGLVGMSMGILARFSALPTTITFFDAVLIILAAFRLVRLVTYDKVMQWFRDLFVRSEVRDGDMGERIVVRQAYPSGPLRAMSELLSCPWCFGVWSAFTVAFFYFLSPIAWYPIFALAAAGVASFITLLANLIGWYAEHKKLEHERALR